MAIEGTSAGKTALIGRPKRGCYLEDGVIVLGAGAGGGGTIAALVMKSWAVGGLAGVAAAVTLVALWRIRKYRPAYDLAARVRELDQENSELRGGLTQLEGELNQLKSAKSELESLVDELQGKDALQLKELNEARTSFANNLEKLEKLQALYNGYKGKAEKLREGLEAVRDGQQQTERLSDEVAELGNTVTDLEREQQAAAESLQGFEEAITAVALKFAEMQEEIGQLRGQVTQVGDAARRIGTGAEALQQTGTLLDKRLGELDRLTHV